MQTHKSDKNLLELAAKAAGYQMDVDGRFFEKGEPTMENWNPLTDDGDALRLAVKIAEVQGYFPLLIDKVCAKTSAPDGTYIHEFVPIGGCFAAATRRAIVRAAAEIGKTL